VKVNDSVDEKMSAKSANAGLRAGSLAGLVMGLYAVATILLLRSRVLEQLAVAKDKLARFMPNIDLNTFYLLGLFAVPAAMVLVYLVVGVLFGTVFDKAKPKPRLKLAAFIVLFIFGFFFGLTTNLPVSKVLPIAASLCSCLVFVFLFLSHHEKGKREEIRAKEREGRCLPSGCRRCYSFSLGFFILAWHKSHCTFAFLHVYPLHSHDSDLPLL
jgi:hypothetical protein